MALLLPEVTEGARFGQRTWFVRGKGFAWERPLNKADLKRLGDETSTLHGLIPDPQRSTCVSNSRAVVARRYDHAGTQTFGRCNRLGAQGRKTDVLVHQLTHPPGEFLHCEDDDGFGQRNQSGDHRRPFIDRPRAQQRATTVTCSTFA